MLTFLPMTSAAAYPNRRSAPGLKDSIRPRASITMMASTAASTTDRSRASLSLSFSMSRLRSVTSRATARPPMTAPEASFRGDTVSDTSMRRPSFVSRTVSWRSTRSPCLMRSRSLVVSSTAPGGIRTCTERPTIASAGYPYINSAPRFQLRIVPCRSFARIASSDDSINAVRIRRVSSWGRE